MNAIRALNRHQTRFKLTLDKQIAHFFAASAHESTTIFDDPSHSALLAASIVEYSMTKSCSIVEDGVGLTQNYNERYALEGIFQREPIKLLNVIQSLRNGRLDVGGSGGVQSIKGVSEEESQARKNSANRASLRESVSIG